MPDKKRKRSVEFKLRATKDEANKIRQRFSPPTITCSSICFRDVAKWKIITYDYSELQKLRIEINRIGQNVNQLVRYVNTFDEIDNELFKALQAEIDDMKKMLFDEFKTKGHAKLNGSDEGSSD